MATWKTSDLSPMAAGRLKKALDKLYAFSDGTRSLREQIERADHIVKTETDAMWKWNRRHSNRLEGEKQEQYEAKLKAERTYWINGIEVPKTVYDALEG